MEGGASRYIATSSDGASSAARALRRIVFHGWGWEDFTYWAGADKKMLRRLLRLIEEARRTPFDGAGKPEPLRGNLAGFWSRRIDDEHRLVYGATDDELIVIQARYRYDG